MALINSWHRLWDEVSGDFKCAYPCPISSSQKETCTKIPKRYPAYAQREHNVLKSTKNIYGSRKVSFSWCTSLSENLSFLIELTKEKFDQCIYYYNSTILLTYVDEFLVLGRFKCFKTFVIRLRESYEITFTHYDSESGFLDLNHFAMKDNLHFDKKELH